MITNVSRFEILPNEMLIEIFQYFDARDLFRTFYNLNLHFNKLLQTLNNLSITFLRSNSNDIDDSYIFSHISIIILDREVKINLNNFINIRRLKFLSPTCEQLDILNSLYLPYLEHLSLGYSYSCYHYLYENHRHRRFDKLFSNDIPNLISCYLFHPYTFCASPSKNQLLKLRILRVGHLSLMNYQIILSTFPNLYFLRFTFPSGNEKFLINKLHLNLRHMVIDFDMSASPLNDYNIDEYLSYVPNLEQLSVHRENEDSNITPYLSYNWLSKLIDQYLWSLHRFKYHFHIYLAEELIKNDHENILKRLEENFNHIHNNRYQSKLIIKLSSYSIID